jgi:uncharacterized SAM-binding protein YcdF (DUF218 family)
LNTGESRGQKPGKFASIVVLANLMTAEGILNDESRARMDRAIAAYRAKVSNILVTCGWAYRADSSVTIADAMRRYALACEDIPSGNVITEEQSRDTVGDAVFTKRNLAIPRGWRDVLVVTSAYHVERSRRIFSFIYGPTHHIEVVGAPGPDNEHLRRAELQSLEVFDSTFHGIEPGDDGAIMERLGEKHPFYNGQVYPKISV